MATLLLGAVGTLIGGPLGGAVGALAGRQIDGAIIGSGTREGLRLKELAITTSSYGQPLPRHHGRVRVGGTIIWATDLKENRETSGGGKGRPRTTSYSYSTSFAVALSSRPVGDIGRIWADGTLLRGAGGDLKTGGTIRIHNGFGDQQVDPLIAAAQGAQCPAFRNCAYVVFEDLELTDYGNRIPALTFELMPLQDGVELAALAGEIAPDVTGEIAFDGLQGFSYEGGTLRDMLSTIGQAYPLAGYATETGLHLADATAIPEGIKVLPEPALAWEEGDFGTDDGHIRKRDTQARGPGDALRYYDTERDFQPGLQRADNNAAGGRVRTIEFPGSLSSDTAKILVERIARRRFWKREALCWRVAELDPSLAPGSPARLPTVPGIWRIAEWEWRERGIELTLVRDMPVQPSSAQPSSAQGDPGLPWIPFDGLPSPTRLRAFELPWDGHSASDGPSIFAAASADGGYWAGAALYAEQGAHLTPLGPAGRTRATGGMLAAELAPSPSLLFERHATATVDLHAEDMEIVPATLDALATGANRLLIGSEIVQFASADKIDSRRWELRGLLRGRGGTERTALTAHGAGTPVTMLDDTLTPLEPARLAVAEPRIAAIGRAEAEPVFAEIENPGATRKPLMPVHGRAVRRPDGALVLCWIRRARGVWDWRSGIETPLIEETELYRVGVGPTETPYMTWETSAPSLTIDPATMAVLASEQAGQPIWVRQAGSFDLSAPLLLVPVS